MKGRRSGRSNINAKWLGVCKHKLIRCKNCKKPLAINNKSGLCSDCGSEIYDIIHVICKPLNPKSEVLRGK